jgi:acylpyruvate hydrolase
MKIAQFYEKNRIRLGMIRGNALVPIDFDGDMIDFITRGQRSETCGSSAIPLDQVKLAPPVTRPSKIIDIILTGTPSGVGAFREPSVYMEDGDEAVVEIEGMGRLVNRCKTE